MGDAVAAQKDFQNVHLQRTSYLSSRECALEEDLICACIDMDLEALDEARSRSGPHRGAMANLDPVMRELVLEIRVSGRAKKQRDEEKKRQNEERKGVSAKMPSPSTLPSPSPKEELSGEELIHDTDAGFAEMDDIMDKMGLNDDDDDDDDIDLT